MTKISKTKHVTKNGVVKNNPTSYPKDDLYLKDLAQYHGTMGYHGVMGTNVTDGVAYIMQNGYSWFVTDAIVILNMKLKRPEFASVKLKLKGTTGNTLIEDGNGKLLNKQDYKYTNAKKELTLFYTNGVLMLSGEY